jgi:hypothetical protein
VRSEVDPWYLKELLHLKQRKASEAALAARHQQQLHPLGAGWPRAGRGGLACRMGAGPVRSSVYVPKHSISVNLHNCVATIHVAPALLLNKS